MSATFLGFDFGTRRIGIAVGQNLTGTAQGIDTINNSGAQGPWPAIAKLVKEWQPDALVVGLPLTKDGNETNLAKSARAFGQELSEYCDLPVQFIDETLTSRAAETLVSDATAPGKRIIGKRQTLRDQIAAELILQTYLNAHPYKSDVA